MNIMSNILWGPGSWLNAIENFDIFVLANSLIWFNHDHPYLGYHSNVSLDFKTSVVLATQTSPPYIPPGDQSGTWVMVYPLV